MDEEEWNYLKEYADKSSDAMFDALLAKAVLCLKDRVDDLEKTHVEYWMKQLRLLKKKDKL